MQPPSASEPAGVPAARGVGRSSAACAPRTDPWGGTTHPWDASADPSHGISDRRPLAARRRLVFRAEKPRFLHKRAADVSLLPPFGARGGGVVAAFPHQREARGGARAAGVARNVPIRARNAAKGLRKRKAWRHTARRCVQNCAPSALFAPAGLVIIFRNFASAPWGAGGGAGRNKRRVRARGRRFFPTFVRLNSG